MEALLNKIESYGVECEAGPLALCVDWQKLKEHVLLATAQPVAKPVRREIPGGRWSCPTCGKSFLRDLMTRHPDDCVSAQPVAEPVAWLIECKNGFTGWWDGRERVDCRFFDKDPNKAHLFATKAEAEKVIKERGHYCQIATQHQWLRAAQPVAEPVLQCNCDLRLRGQLTAGWVCPVHGQQW